MNGRVTQRLVRVSFHVPGRGVEGTTRLHTRVYLQLIITSQVRRGSRGNSLQWNRRKDACRVHMTVRLVSDFAHRDVPRRTGRSEDRAEYECMEGTDSGEPSSWRPRSANGSVSVTAGPWHMLEA